MSEFDWIARYFAPLATSEGAAGLLDDVATLSGQSTIITTDALVEGVHFLPADPIDTVARKLVRVNVSDIIAKGGLPCQALLTLGWPRKRSEADLAAFAGALGEELALWGAQLIGGDTVASPGGLFLSLTLTAMPAGTRAPVRRAGAQAGDIIWLSGPVGGGLIGLKDARSGKDTAARAHYRVPEIPPLSLAPLIARYGHASMDVSDGLMGDVLKLLGASEMGGQIELADIPLFRASGQLEDVLAQCTGGDDYQALFTAPETATVPLLAAMPALKSIGRITSARGLALTWTGAPTDVPQHAGYTHKFPSG